MLRLMEEYEPLVNNSVAFAEQLSNDLHVLDEVRGARAVIQQKNGAWRGGALGRVTGHRQPSNVLEALSLKDVLVLCCFIPKEMISAQLISASAMCDEPAGLPKKGALGGTLRAVGLGEDQQLLLGGSQVIAEASAPCSLAARPELTSLLMNICTSSSVFTALGHQRAWPLSNDCGGNRG